MFTFLSEYGLIDSSVWTDLDYEHTKEMLKTMFDEKQKNEENEHLKTKVLKDQPSSDATSDFVASSIGDVVSNLAAFIALQEKRVFHNPLRNDSLSSMTTD